MEFTDVIKKRRSTRQYNSQPISQEILNKLYEAVKAAPTGNNLQEFRFIFVTDEKKRQRIANEGCNQDFIGDAQLHVIATCKKGSAFNVAIAMDHMILEATNQGLGSCWIGWFDGEKLKPILGIPKDVDVPIMATIGYTDDPIEVPERKSIEELIGNDKY